MADAERTIQYIPIDEVVRADRNPKRHRADAIANSVSRFGWVEPIVLDERTGKLVAGHGRLDDLLARSTSGATVPEGITVGADGRWMVPVVRGWASADDKAAEAFLVASNRTSEVGGWDDRELADLLSGLRDSDADLLAATAYSQDDLALLLASLDTGGNDPIGDPDDVPEPPAVPVSKRGDLWLLGDHRLACGDSTDAAVVGAVLNGESPTVLLTDPPYSSGGRQEGTSRHSTSIGTRSEERISRDNLTVRGYMALMGSVLGSVSAETAYVFTDWRMWSWTFDVLESSGYPVRNMIVWDKKQMGMGFPWRSQHELVAFAKRSAATLTDGKCGNVLQCSRVPNELHPTQKPVDLLRQLLANSPSGDVVDPFGGSGTTLIAAHEEGRRCRLVEVDEAFCDVICARFERTFGIVPVLESTGVAHSFVDAVA